MDMKPATGPPWTPTLAPGVRPAYLAIADAIAADLQSGRLRAGERLPPQRRLAAALGLDLTTVTRAYNEARARRLVEARVGQGTFVRPQAPPPVRPAGRSADMSMNLPPQFDDPELERRMWGAVDQLRDSQGLGLLLSYSDPAGSPADRSAGAAWLRLRLPDVTADRVLVAPGAQAALAAIVGALAERGDTVCAESLAYPGFRALAAQLQLKVVGLAMDAEGLTPEAFDAACRIEAPKALYCTPTLHNPTTATMSDRRRMAIAGIARRHGVPIVEDDAYGALPDAPIAPIAAYAPELTWHVAGLAKAMSPALRIAYLVAPDRRAAARVAAGLRSGAGMASPLMAALATRWIEGGVGAEVTEAIRRETAARFQLAAEMLPQGAFVGRPDAFHIWIRLPPDWSRAAFAARLRSQEVGVVPSDAFCTAPEPPEAVRFSLGAPATQAETAAALGAIRDALDRDPAWDPPVI